MLTQDWGGLQFLPSVLSSAVIITSLTSPTDHVNNDAVIITGLLWFRLVWTVRSVCSHKENSINVRVEDSAKQPTKLMSWVYFFL